MESLNVHSLNGLEYIGNRKLSSAELFLLNNELQQARRNNKEFINVDGKLYLRDLNPNM